MWQYQINLSLGLVNQSAVVSNRDILSLIVSKPAHLQIPHIQSKFNRIKCLSLKDNQFDKVELTSCFKQLKELEELSFESVKLCDETRTETVEPAKLCNLKILKLKYSDERLFSTFETSNLATCHIHNLESQSDPSNILDFLINQKLLKDLKLVGTLGRNFLLDERIQLLKCRLKRLKFAKTNLVDTEKCLIEFLKQSFNTLEHLAIKNPTSLIVDEFVLLHMSELKSLQVVAQLPSENERFFKKIEPNYHIRNLKIFGRILHFRPFSKVKFLFESVPDLKSLDISKLSGEPKLVKLLPLFYTGHLVGDKPSLTELRCFTVTEIARERVSYNSLKSLHVARIDNENLFNGFVAQNFETLEELSIKEIDDAAFTRSLTVSTISQCIRLKKISIVCRSTAVVKMFSKILWNHSWTFDVKLKVDADKYKKISFRFPDDKPIFNESVRIWDDNLIRDFESSSNYGLNAFVNKFK